jgi:SAM-dependent methyltransferase
MSNTLLKMFGAKADPTTVRQKRDELIAKHGPWTAHNFKLADGVYTFEDGREDFDKMKNGHAVHIRRVTQGVADMCGKRIKDLRVLDLGCLEGIYAIEFALNGAQVVGIEGREASVAKCNFAKDVYGLKNATFVQDDVRNLTVQKYGMFDVVMCFGLLYHLDAPDVFTFTQQMSDVCSRICVIDTHIATEITETRQFKGKQYSGVIYREHQDEAPQDIRLQALWASLDNAKSFWLTRPSLYNMLAESGFTSVHACMNPAIPEQYNDRDTIFALKTQPYTVLCAPETNSIPLKSWPEVSIAQAHPALANLEK